MYTRKELWSCRRLFINGVFYPVMSSQNPYGSTRKLDYLIGLCIMIASVCAFSSDSPFKRFLFLLRRIRTTRLISSHSWFSLESCKRVWCHRCCEESSLPIWDWMACESVREWVMFTMDTAGWMIWWNGRMVQTDEYLIRVDSLASNNDRGDYLP